MSTQFRVRVGIAAGALFIGGLIGLALGFVLDDESGGPQESGVPVPAHSSPGPTGEINGVPVGFARTEEGAVAAARVFALVTETDLIRDEGSLTEAMEQISTPEWAATAREQAEGGYEFLLGRYGDDVEVSAAVLRYDLVDYSPDEAVVRLWIVTLATGSQFQGVDQVWGTALVSLKWMNDDWRLDHAENETGPEPAGTSSPESDSAKSFMEEFDDVVYGDP